MQFQADMLGVSLRRPANAETTALGAAYLAGLTTGFWPDTAALVALREGEERFLPTFDESARAERLARWRDAVARVRS
jgi:glycerol kinase